METEEDGVAGSSPADELENSAEQQNQFDVARVGEEHSSGEEQPSPELATEGKIEPSSIASEESKRDVVQATEAAEVISPAEEEEKPPQAQATDTAEVAPEATVEVVKPRDPNLVAITLRPMNKNWVMGEDWVVDFHNLVTIVDIRAFIEKERGISRHRIQLRLKGKVLAKNREIWTLRRLGIYDGYTIQVEPTLSGSWLWEPREYYINKLMTDITDIINTTAAATGCGRINLKDLNSKIQPPPCFTCSLRVFLRQYPEKFYIHKDTTDGDMWVHLTTRPFQLPTFGNFSVEIGTFQYYKPKPYNWAANKDIDDMYKIETLPGELAV